MSDDWRLYVRLHSPEHAGLLAERLGAVDLEHELEATFHDRVAVSRDDDEVFCYTDTREQAERARALVQKLASEHGWEIELELRRWHPVAEEWEDPEKPLPATGPELAAEHQELIEQEREESQEQGYPEFEVRVQCRSRADAIELAKRLEAEGIPSLRRWHYLLIGAPDEDTARELAGRIDAESPPGSIVSTEGSGRAAAAIQPGNPFALFGGLAG